ncbi:hypothetical protein HUJ04_006218 [Dendroctonus ponderosae]|uniref:Histone-lysine N-methyltransferase n=1 Tax=Dendroctonus ponderosae TaxID=77166 RepID=A0AAR5Q886_DENPD|nr:hypothetical protein HUJ04_006218 [Dendroctonus ponderosae]
MECIDNYEHLSPQVMYFAKCLPSREIEKTMKPTSVFCNCKDSCSEETNCNCIKRSGTKFCFTDVEDLESYRLVAKSVNRPTYECNDQCQCCASLCGNKLVQCGPRKGLEVKLCEDARKGEGVFAGDPIAHGSFVCEYAGEIISEKEASIRFKLNAKHRRMNYIFCIDEHFGDNSVKTFIDPTVYGNIGRYINHSCDPNCSMIITRIHDNIPVLGIYACRDIKTGEELSYDYGISDLSGGVGELEPNRTKCLCGSTNCRGFLPYDSKIM